MENSIIIITILTILIIIIILYINYFVNNLNKTNNKIESFINITIDDNELAEFSYGLSETSKIPNIIWTFWDGQLTDTVTKCIDSWRFYNPTYKIYILNKSNYSQFINQDFDSTFDPNIDSIKHANESLQRYSDYVRLAILAKYGGFWIDASIICHHPFTWIHGVQNKLDVEFIAYYGERFTESNYKKYSPIIESWFFACIPNSQFINDWRDEFFSSKKFNSISNYLENIYKDKISPQKIIYLDYLAIYISTQKLLQKNINKYKLCLFSDKYGPYSQLYDANLDTIKSVDNLINKNTYKKYHKNTFIKLRRMDRILFDKNINKNNAYSHLSKNK